MTDTETFVFRSVIICDEVREEVGGKQFLIGVYSGVVLLPYAPYWTAQLSFRFEVAPKLSHYDHVDCTILRPNSSIFVHETKALDVRFPNYPMNLEFILSGLNFEQVGEYTILLAMDGTPHLVSTFMVITADNVPNPS